MNQDDSDWLAMWDEYYFMFQEDVDDSPSGLSLKAQSFWNMDEDFNMLAIAEGRA